VIAALLLAQIDVMQRRSALPQKSLPVIDLEATIAAGSPTLVYLLSDATATPSPNYTPSAEPETSSEASLATAVAEFIPTCSVPPEGWTLYTINAGDSFHGLAERFGEKVDTIIQVNCLPHGQITVGQQIFLPNRAQSHAMVDECGAPPGWVQYVVQPGDTLQKLSFQQGTSMHRLFQANCLENKFLIVGRKLFIPPAPHPKPIPAIPTTIPK